LRRLRRRPDAAWLARRGLARPGRWWRRGRGGVTLTLRPGRAVEVGRDGVGSAPRSLAAEGFVHCTGDDQLMLAVANRFYASDPDELVVVTLDRARLTSEVRGEPPAHPDGRPSTGTEPFFPHVYGPLDRDAVLAVRRLVRSSARFCGYEPIM